MSLSRHDVEARVIAEVADVLDVSPDRVTPHASLIDDLGAESIDFLDIVFRLESAFRIKIAEADIWKGSIDASDPDSIARGVQRLRARMPDFPWDRLPARMSPHDLPRLITVATIVDYLEQRSQDLRAPADTRLDAS